jgi:hypothetical protein
MPNIKANELRIGNLVDLGNRIAKVIEINHLACVVVDLEETQDTIEDYERTKPIPLTEEWLVNFGFVKQDYNMSGCDIYQLKNIIIMKSFINPERKLGITVKGISPPTWSLKDLIYVHELQNLYFALTGEELVVKE